MAAAVSPLVAPGRTSDLVDLKIHTHSGLPYGWPVCAVAFLMALWAALDNHHMLVVPEGTVVEAKPTEHTTGRTGRLGGVS
jgi:hypothetical protein